MRGRRSWKPRNSRRRDHDDPRAELRRLLEALVDAGLLQAKTEHGQRMYRRPPGLSDEEWLAGVAAWRNEGRTQDA
jgi:hypothetical protein